MSSMTAQELPKIDPDDQALINELRKRIHKELELVPSYDDDYSLLRWLIGWDRHIEVVVPKLKMALNTIHAMRLDVEDFSSLEKITAYLDAISKPSYYMPGSLIGFDKQGNVVSLQAVGRLDGPGLLQSTMISDLYVLRIAESEGVMQIIRENEKKLGRQLGTVVIIDLDGISLDNLEWTALKAVTNMLSHLQELFPDVLRKLFIIRAPSFVQLLWSAVSPCLAKQTKQKIEFLGNDWKERLKEVIDESMLYEHWGGTKPAETPYGDVRMGGKVPKELRYDSTKDECFKNKELKSLTVSARSSTFVPVLVKGEYNPDRKLRWWWRAESGDLDFGVRLSASENGTQNSEEATDIICWPKFRLLTEFVPESREVAIPNPGLYKLTFDNSHGKLWSKQVKYCIRVIE
uniref:CRAL-TRIO domain-containing protein n=1 Tax=Acrobeloides nanus TaxID=290746 RepID=A0A914DAX1_9BILA